MDKNELRRSIKEQRRALSSERIQMLSGRIEERLLGCETVRGAKTVMCYYPIKGEPDIRHFMERLRGLGKEICLPVVMGEDMKAVVWEHEAELVKVPPGVMQPAAGRQPDKIDVVIVPGLAFDKRGTRMGFGRGYYDRFLTGCQACKLGVVFDEFMMEELDASPWDVPMDAVFTDKRFFDFTSGKK